jgi:hypothetical protein
MASSPQFLDLRNNLLDRDFFNRISQYKKVLWSHRFEVFRQADTK